MTEDTKSTPVLDQEPVLEKTETSKLSKHEEQALARGWKPKDQWQGEEDDFVDAKEFLRGGELRDHIHKINRKLKDLQGALDHSLERNQKLHEISYKKAMDDLLAQQRQATQSGNVNAVSQLTDQIVQLKEEIKASPPAVSSADKAAREFIERNKDWYASRAPDHIAMQAFSQAKADELSIQNPGLSAEEIFDMTETAVKTHFPQAFKEAKSERKTMDVLPPSQDAPRGAAYSHLPERIKKDIQRLQRHSPEFDVKKYIADLKFVGEI